MKRMAHGQKRKATRNNTQLNNNPIFQFTSVSDLILPFMLLFPLASLWRSQKSSLLSGVKSTRFYTFLIIKKHVVMRVTQRWGSKIPLKSCKNVILLIPSPNPTPKQIKTAVFTHFWQEHKLVQPSWKAIWHYVSKTFKMFILFKLAIPSLVISPKVMRAKIYVQRPSWLCYLWEQKWDITLYSIIEE